MSVDYVDGAIRESIAKNGITKICRILDEAGFKDIEGLKDYEVSAEISGESVFFYISVAFESLDDMTRERLQMEAQNFKKRRDQASTRAGAKKIVKKWVARADGKPQKIQGRFDARRPVRDSQSVRPDARKTSAQRARKPTFKTAPDRLIQQEITLTNPRGMHIEEDKLHISLEREIRKKDDKTILPMAEYQGIMRSIIDRVTETVQKAVATHLPEILG